MLFTRSPNKTELTATFINTDKFIWLLGSRALSPSLSQFGLSLGRFVLSSYIYERLVVRTMKTKQPDRG